MGHAENRLETVIGPQDAEVDRLLVHSIWVLHYSFVAVKVRTQTDGVELKTPK